MKLLESTNGGQHKLKIYIRWIETRKNHFSAYYKIGSIKDLRHFKRDLPIARFAEQVIIRGFKGDIYKFLYFKFSKPERDVIKQTILSILRSFPIIYQFIDLLWSYLLICSKPHVNILIQKKSWYPSYHSANKSFEFADAICQGFEIFFYILIPFNVHHESANQI